MKRVIIYLLTIGTLIFGLAGCNGSWGTPANQRDLEGVKPRVPDKIESYTNIDQHPNVVRLCIGGVAFVTTSRDYDSILRVPEFDTWCRNGVGE